jgi:single-strand DNA-binding protein
MSHTVPFKLNENAKEFQAGDYVGFGIRTGIKYQDSRTKQDMWTNYQAAIFAKSPAKIEFYRANLIKNALVVVTGDKLSVEVFNGQNVQQTSIKIHNANVVAVKTDRAPDAAQQAYSKELQKGVQQSTQQNNNSFDEDLPW